MRRTPLLPILVAGLLFAGTAAADQRDPQLDGLFSRLTATSDAEEATQIDRQIWTVWLRSGDDAIDRLLQQGTLAMATQSWPVAVTAFTHVVELRPDFAEGWNKRATLYYLMGRYDESASDVEKTLALEPRHYGALSGMGLIEMQRENPKQALEWFRKGLAVNPHMESIREMTEKLETLVEGKPI